MPVLENYEGAAAVFLNGNLLSDAASFRGSLKTNDNVVKTMLKGIAGFSDGAEELEGTIEVPPPRDGFRVDWYAVVRQRETIRLEFDHAGARRQGEGRITQYEWNNAQDQTAGVTLSFMGKPTGDL